MPLSAAERAKRYRERRGQTPALPPWQHLSLTDEALERAREELSEEDFSTELGKYLFRWGHTHAALEAEMNHLIREERQ